jgi:diguanylate cyclase (GGDEF)-like protein
VPARELSAEVDLLGRESALLLRLEAFGGPSVNRLAAAVASVEVVGADDRASLLDALEAADGSGAAALRPLTVGRVSPDVSGALGPLSSADLSALRDGRPTSLDAESYLRALDQLLRSSGAGSGTPPEVDRIAVALAGERVEVAAVRSSRTWSLLALAGVLLLAAAGWLLARRRGPRSSSRPVVPVAPQAPGRVLPAQPGATSMHDLLDASRRLTGAAASGDIDRMLVREALGLVSASGAALVSVDGELEVRAESEPDLLVPEELAGSVLRRVADTGQFHVQVSATERALRSLPAALVAVPLVGGGRVEAVLVVVRPEHRPFTSAECEVLHAYGPVAAAALHSARQARATIEDGLVDGLTRVGNRRRFDRELDDALAAPTTTSLIIVDLDRFKLVNDTHGHPAGDALLRGVADVVRAHVRPGDSVYRFGGEEFCVLLRETDEAEAARVAERVRETLAVTPFDIGQPEPLRVTASFGVSQAVGPSPAALLGRADAALYRAKHGGRNRVELARADDASSEHQAPAP